MRIRILFTLFFAIGVHLVSAQQDSSFLPPHPYLALQKPAIFMVVDYHQKESKDALFSRSIFKIYLNFFFKHH